MAHAPRSPHIPARDGLRASCVALPAGPWASVLDFLAQRLPALSRAQWHQRLASGDVLTEQGQPLPPDAPYRSGQRLYYWRHLPSEPQVPGQEQVIYHDSQLLVADKPHFLPVTPGGRYARQTLLVRLQQRLGVDTLTPIHRIDRETAGLVLFCVSPQARAAYHALVRQNGLSKTYQAIAPAPSASALQAPADAQGWRERRSRLAADEQRFFISREIPGEPNSLTRWRVLRELPPAQPGGPPLALYALQPVSGRRHQLRVHMAALGMPICGDRFYPQVQESAQALPGHHSPLQLLAHELRFTDPLSGQPRCFTSALRLDWGSPA